jgi:hypothetical protein
VCSGICKDLFSFYFQTTHAATVVDAKFLSNVAVPWLASPSPRKPGLAPGPVHVGFVVVKVALGQVFFRVLKFSPLNNIAL